MTSTSRPLALVTGASSGIGLAFAQQLAASGHDLVVVARRKERLDALAASVAKEHGAKAEVLVADLASEAGTAAVEARLARRDVDLLVNNAGVSRYRPFLQLEPAMIDELVRLHVLGTTRLARAALPSMVEKKRGGVINVASLLALSGTVPPSPLPHRAVYAASKAYLLAFTQQLAFELAGTDVRAQVLLAGLVDTEFHDDMGPAKAHLPPRMKPSDLVQASLLALARNEVVCAPAVADASVFERVGEAQRAVFGSARMTELAPRYAK